MAHLPYSQPLGHREWRFAPVLWTAQSFLRLARSAMFVSEPRDLAGVTHPTQGGISRESSPSAALPNMGNIRPLLIQLVQAEIEASIDPIRLLARHLKLVPVQTPTLPRVPFRSVNGSQRCASFSNSSRGSSSPLSPVGKAPCLFLGRDDCKINAM